VLNHLRKGWKHHNFGFLFQGITLIMFALWYVDAKSLVNIQDSHLNDSSSNFLKIYFMFYNGYNLNKHVQDSINYIINKSIQTKTQLERM